MLYPRTAFTSAGRPFLEYQFGSAPQSSVSCTCSASPLAMRRNMSFRSVGLGRSLISMVWLQRTVSVYHGLVIPVHSQNEDTWSLETPYGSPRTQRRVRRRPAGAQARRARSTPPDPHRRRREVPETGPRTDGPPHEARVGRRRTRRRLRHPHSLRRRRLRRLRRRLPRRLGTRAGTGAHAPEL